MSKLGGGFAHTKIGEDLFGRFFSNGLRPPRRDEKTKSGTGFLV